MCITITIIPRACVGYKMIDSQGDAYRRAGYLSSHIQQALSGIIFLLKKNREIFKDLADFALKEQPEDNLMLTTFLGNGFMVQIQ